MTRERSGGFTVLLLPIQESEALAVVAGEVFVNSIQLVFIVLAHLAIKSYDLVVALTSGGPGGSAWLPSNTTTERGTWTRPSLCRIT